MIQSLPQQLIRQQSVSLRNDNCFWQGEDGETALLLASTNGHHEIVKLLINYGADPNHVDHVSTL